MLVHEVLRQSLEPVLRDMRVSGVPVPVIREDDWSSTNWPLCPNHPVNHPLSASVIGRVAVWTCPSDGTVFCPVGALP